jgi:hypothetical protein
MAPLAPQERAAAALVLGGRKLNCPRAMSSVRAGRNTCGICRLCSPRGSQGRNLQTFGTGESALQRKLGIIYVNLLCVLRRTMMGVLR